MANAFKVWVEIEEVDEEGDQISICDLPFASTAMVNSYDEAVRIARVMHAAIELQDSVKEFLYGAMGDPLRHIEIQQNAKAALEYAKGSPLTPSECSGL